MRWPFMLKSTHEAHVIYLTETYQAHLFEAQLQIDREYARATREGRAQVHAWARELTSVLYLESHPNIFRNKALAAFQQAERQFAPSKTDIKEI